MIDRTRFSPVDILSFQENGEQYFTVQIAGGSAGLEAAEALFEAHDNYPNGYGWEGLITYFLTVEDPEFLEKMDFDCEAGAFLATLESAEDMLKLAGMLQDFIKNEPKLVKYLAELPDEFKDS